jgi:hypothetical protein
MSSLVTTKSFCAGDGTLQIENLYSLLDVLWQEERKNSSEVFRPRWLISSSAQET